MQRECYQGWPELETREKRFCSDISGDDVFELIQQVASRSAAACNDILALLGVVGAPDVTVTSLFGARRGIAEGLVRSQHNGQQGAQDLRHIVHGGSL